jgi:zinc transport system substrate-binding protein
MRTLAIASLVLGLLAPGCHRDDPASLTVLAATANVGAVARAVGGSRVKVTTVAPAGMCPGHFDIRPSHVAAAERARLIIHQGWESWFPEFANSLPGEISRRIVRASTPGNWMLPETHLLAVDEMTALLVAADSGGADSFRLRAAAYGRRVDSTARDVRARFRERRLPLVIGADHQSGMLTWLGFRVIATYGRPESFTARELSRLAQVAVDSGVGLVVDNLQSGPDAGRELARALGIPQLTLSNFPLDDDYPATLDAIADSLLARLR